MTEPNFGYFQAMGVNTAPRPAVHARYGAFPAASDVSATSSGTRPRSRSKPSTAQVTLEAADVHPIWSPVTFRKMDGMRLVRVALPIGVGVTVKRYRWTVSLIGLPFAIDGLSVGGFSSTFDWHPFLGISQVKCYWRFPEAQEHLSMSSTSSTISSSGPWSSSSIV